MYIIQQLDVFNISHILDTKKYKYNAFTIQSDDVKLLP